MDVMIKRCASAEQPGWLALRQALWPHCILEEHLAEMSMFCANPERYVQFITYAQSGQAGGFVEAAVRTDYVNGTRSSPVAFLEGIYVVSEEDGRASHDLLSQRRYLAGELKEKELR